MLCQKFTFLSTFLLALTTSTNPKVDKVKVNKFAIKKKNIYLVPSQEKLDFSFIWDSFDEVNRQSTMYHSIFRC